MLDKWKWLNAATAKIRFGPDRRAVQRELEGHLEDAEERHAAAGLPEEEAERAALAAMGDPAAVAEELGRLHKPWLGYLWRASQILLLAAAALCCALAARQAAISPIGYAGLPGMNVRSYLKWEFRRGTDMPGTRELPAGMEVRTGSYTIRVDRAVLRPGGLGEPPRRDLVLDLHIGTGWRGEELDWPGVIAEVRDSEGNVYAPGEGDRRYSFPGASGNVWGLGQKTGLTLENVPEDAAWIEADVGYGSLTRTLHIGLTEGAGT